MPFTFGTYTLSDTLNTNSSRSYNRATSPSAEKTKAKEEALFDDNGKPLKGKSTLIKCYKFFIN